MITLNIKGDKIDIYEDGGVFRHQIERKWDGKIYPAKWITPQESGRGYKIVQIRRKNYYLHRLLAQAFLPNYSKNLQVDHINGNKEDNRLENLRLVTPLGNSVGYQKKRKNTTSRFKGVSFCPQQRKWKAAIQYNKKYRFIGRYDTEEAAAKAWNEAAKLVGMAKEALNLLSP